MKAPCSTCTGAFNCITTYKIFSLLHHALTTIRSSFAIINPSLGTVSSRLPSEYSRRPKWMRRTFKCICLSWQLAASDSTLIDCKHCAARRIENYRKGHRSNKRKRMKAYLNSNQLKNIRKWQIYLYLTFNIVLYGNHLYLGKTSFTTAITFLKFLIHTENNILNHSFWTFFNLTNIKLVIYKKSQQWPKKL